MGFVRKCKEDRPVLAICYDFDKTLSPDNMQAQGYIQSVGFDEDRFWEESNAVAVANDMDSNLAYMLKMVQEAEGNLVLTRKALAEYGSRVRLYPGVEGWFDRMRRYGQEHGVIVEHYIISSGLVEEARGLAAQGVKELIVIAQDTTYYGLDRYGKRCLARLLEQLAKIDGIEWIRLHYSYPTGFPEDVLRLMADNPKICPYIDIPLQHSADRVLSMMRRGIDGRQTRDLVAKMRDLVPGVVLRTTLIVGHPGEGEAEFRDLLDFVRESRFERLGAFQYSEEEGTYGALHYKDEIPPEVKQERYDRLMELQSGISLAYNRSRVGTRTRVLVDSVSDGVLVARSQTESPEVDGEILVRASAPVGHFLDVNIVGADEYDLLAEI